MPFFQIEKIKCNVRIFGILLLLLLLIGCVAQKTEDVKTAEQTQPGTDTSVQNAVDQEDRLISAITIEENDQTIEIQIQGNKKLVYTSIKQAFPFGIAIYLPETKIAESFKNEVTENRSIGDLIVKYADEEMTTAKIEILLKEDLNYEVAEADNTLNVSLFGTLEKTQTIVSTPPEPVSTAVEPKSKEQLVSEETVIIPNKTAKMTDIEFNAMEDGNSDIVVKTNHPVKYDITQGKNGKIYLNLYNTIIPDYHKRPILTHYFKSAVKRLMPIQVPGKKKNSKIEIETRDQVPYRIVQNQSTISIFFEPSRIEPPIFTKAKKKVISGTQTQVGAAQNYEKEISPKGEPDKAGIEVAAIEKKEKTLEEEIFGPPKKYTGEKIKLDFYETDIKNVFRILRSVGGLNFAIDKNVKGKVTLTLENAVPWDQVLDLVLRMNSLGMKEEGNVIRIATLETLKKEEKLIQEMIAAKKKSLAQKKSLEPLVTEYIPINYSDATADIKPHVDDILTKRGTASVNTRTNMIIITDIQAKVDQAKEIIFKLDQVTPQIMIEAKVVEVTKNFTRTLGLGLSLTQAQTKDTNPRPHDYTVALNSPLTSAVNTGSYNIYRILGSQFLSLNAQISASETKGEVKVVSSPRILTLDNKQASIKQGLEYAYLERDSSGGSSVKFKSIDLLLDVTPHVTPDKRIGLTVNLTKNDIDSITNGVPSLSTNSATTELLVNNNDTIVIGGIVKTTDTDSVTGTPFLSGIPILGRLFRTDTDTDNRTELLIFITPSIVQLEQKRNTFTTQD
ncbi:MAG: type IV pilus secretin PilQ [Desulfobacteraceae bacterium]|nr:type IV pilus secretin PilQ [Desulfobacteraceae bacterium]